MGAFVAVVGIAGVFLIDNPKKFENIEKKNTSYWADLFYGFKPSVIKENSGLYLVLSAFCIFNCAFQVFFPYLFIYLGSVVLPANESVNLMSAGVIIPAVISVASIIAGIVILMKVSDKNKAYGFVPAVILMVIGLFILSRTTNLVGVLVGVGPTLIGYLVLTIQLNAAIRDFIPVGKEGLFQGIRMIFVVLIPMVVGPVMGDIACRNSAVTYMNEYGVDTIVPSSSMFLYSCIFAVLVFVPLGVLIKKGFEIKETRKSRR
jgi:hypothetical protein